MWGEIDPIGKVCQRVNRSSTPVDKTTGLTINRGLVIVLSLPFRPSPPPSSRSHPCACLATSQGINAASPTWAIGIHCSAVTLMALDEKACGVECDTIEVQVEELGIHTCSYLHTSPHLHTYLNAGSEATRRSGTTSREARNTSHVLASPARLGSLSTRVATTMMPWRGGAPITAPGEGGPLLGGV